MLSYCFLSSIITTEKSVIRPIIYLFKYSLFFLWSLLDILFLLLFWNLLNWYFSSLKMPLDYFPFEYCISSILPFWELEDMYFRSSQLILPYLYNSNIFYFFVCLWLPVTIFLRFIFKTLIFFSSMLLRNLAIHWLSNIMYNIS